MIGRREGASLEFDHESENIDKPARREIKVIRANKPLDIKLGDFNEVPKEAESNTVERQPIDEWAANLRAAVKLKESEKPTEQDRAREEIDKLLGRK